MLIDQILLPLIGGAMIGFSAAMMMQVQGQICGISGMAGGALWNMRLSDWRLAFLLGLVTSGFVVMWLWPARMDYQIPVDIITVIIGGLLVGVGTQLGSGCTSGHGICGISRASKRSITATLTFMAVATLTAFLRGLF